MPHAYSLHENGAPLHVRPDAHDMREEEGAWLHIEGAIDNPCAAAQHSLSILLELSQSYEPSTPAQYPLVMAADC